jgi:hypothetical protein
MPVLRGFPGQNVVAVYNEAPGGGPIDNINSPRNAPALNPGAHLDRVIWHIDFFQYELALPIQTVNVNHPSLAGRNITWGQDFVFNSAQSNLAERIRYEVPGNTATASRTLVTHGLGYEPLAFVAYNGRLVMPGVAVQTASEGRNRFVSSYVTNTIVGLREVYNSSANALGAVSRSYQVVVFRVPVAEGMRALFGKEGDNVVLGRGKVDTSRQYFRQLLAGDSPFVVDRGRTVDIDGGRARIVSGGQTTTEAGYGGSFSASPFITLGL